MRASLELERLRQRGADFLLIPETALWWLQHYTRFAEHIKQHYAVRADGGAPGIVVALSERFTSRTSEQRCTEAMDKAMSRESYQELVEDVRACVRACVPPGAVVLIASKGDEDLVQIEGLRAWHFPRDEWGSYAGHHPASSVEAIVHLRHLFAQGARYLVFPATAAWWLEHYRELADLLDSAHELKLSHDGVCVVYELRESAAFDAFAAMDPGGASWDGGDDKAGAPTQLLTLARPAPRPSLRVLTILTRFGSEQYAEAEVEIADLFTQQLRPVERQVDRRGQRAAARVRRASAPTARC